MANIFKVLRCLLSFLPLGARILNRKQSRSHNIFLIYNIYDLSMYVNCTNVSNNTLLQHVIFRQEQAPKHKAVVKERKKQKTTKNTSEYKTKQKRDFCCVA